ncbi:HAD-IA family hydrolase [Chitinophaga sp. CC14]|uniref:HAD family hydrolase n=1 Tax=Chitinophaga sp. CC14 TaxID=3029199 RepID=UPI003B7D0F90
MKIKAVIFDLDGTLANTLPLCIRAFKESVQPLLQRTLSDEEIVATFGPSEEGTIMALVPGHYNEGVSSYLHLYAELHSMCPAPFEGMPEILQMLKQKNVPVAMVTGKGEHSTAISLKYFSLADYFSMIETGSPLGPRKVQGIQAVLKAWPEIDKREVIYVGDAPSDITASRTAGISVVAAAWASTANAEILESMIPDALFLNIQAFSNWLIDNIEK